ncbi:CCA tRNA nucleotidyltransferase [Bacillus sp. V5-8f]|uniref:CCA tRNA nucleotidyltransferase n=1 Tax=Bacillus sp. V5-8f TaxID=2053044 RepID=UPI000C76F6E3|nr:CCA tRNA nucleotidyltransferase [Bacillus sp. V5-8f]PLT34895.1 CCA tRNA nucleotidyltransferase [Bacillus sp. V5-8f]
MHKIFQKAVPILEQIEEAGFEAYFVGGSVRDYILQKEINDVDIASSATPYEIKKIFANTVDVGIEHGTVIVLHEGEGYEITTFRTEGNYSDFRRPDTVEFIRSLMEDLKRRDFTMNAMAMDKTGQIQDPFHGKKAIESKMIVTVGNPDERFREDALRMMRAIRFVSQLSFDVEGQTLQSMKQNSFLLEQIAVERLYIEFNKLLKGNNRKTAFLLLVQTGLYKYLPGFTSIQEALQIVRTINTGQLDNPVEFWALLLSIGKIDDTEAFLRVWKMPVKNIREIGRLCFHVENKTDFIADKKALFSSGLNEAVKATKIHAVMNHNHAEDAANKVREAYRRLPIHSIKELDVNGNDLVSWFGRRPGPWVKEEMERILSAILWEDIINRKEDIKEWLKRCNRM